jgi:glycosyltransferase involved in cell wall biosynthesis
MISVCIPVKNRIKNLKECVGRLQELGGDFEIVVADNMSTDTDFSDFHNSPHHVTIIREVGDWSIGRFKNLAAENAKGDILFFLDADLIVPQEIIDKIQKLVPLGYAYCPIMFMENREATGGEWGIHSFGQIAVTKEQWQAHKWPEWTSYGGDDNYFYEPYKDGKAIRDQPFGFIHKWHDNDERLKHYKDEAGTHLTQWNIEHYGVKATPDLAIDE